DGITGKHLEGHRVEEVRIDRIEWRRVLDVSSPQQNLTTIHACNRFDPGKALLQQRGNARRRRRRVKTRSIWRSAGHRDLVEILVSGYEVSMAVLAADVQRCEKCNAQANSPAEYADRRVQPAAQEMAQISCEGATEHNGSLSFVTQRLDRPLPS